MPAPMSRMQPGILAPVPALARYLHFSMVPGAKPEESLRSLRDLADGSATVVGLGRSLVRALGRDIEGLGSFTPHAGAGFEVPSTPGALWCWMRGEDRGELVHRGRAMAQALRGLRLDRVIDAFCYGTGRDLTGYEDGTENPVGKAALKAASVAGRGSGLDGSSFVAVQQWVHDLDLFEAMSVRERDNIIGRRQSDNRELAHAPVSAHVKRTAQESFTPEAFILRRSMPWADATQQGLVFVAFGKSFAAFEAQLRRMAGAEDGIADALFRFTRPVTGGYFWCPPMKKGRLDLSTVGL